jgi:hypothetical protein
MCVGSIRIRTNSGRLIWGSLLREQIAQGPSRRLRMATAKKAKKPAKKAAKKKPAKKK